MSHTGQIGTIVAVHGFTGHPDDFAVLRHELPQLDWVTPTLPGHDGRRSRLTPCTLDRAAESVGAALQLAAAGQQPIWLLGYSMGARIVLHSLLQAAVIDLDRLAGVVLVSATAGIDDERERLERREADEALARRIETVGTTTFLDEWRRTPLMSTHARIPAPWRQAIEAARARHDASGLASSLRDAGTGRMDPLWSRLGGLTRPTLVVWGEDDRKFAALGERLAAGLPDATGCAIARAGHAAHLEQPRSFAEALASFASRTAAQPPSRSPRP